MNKFTMLSCLFMFWMVTFSQANHSGRMIYIVYMGALPSNSNYFAIRHNHFTLLRSVTGKSYTPGLIVTHYGKSFDGFAAWLTKEERKKLSVMPHVISVFPSWNQKFNKDKDLINDDVSIDSGLMTPHLAPSSNL